MDKTLKDVVENQTQIVCGLKEWVNVQIATLSTCAAHTTELQKQQQQIQQQQQHIQALTKQFTDMKK